MPLYDYKCPECSYELTISRQINARDDPLMCDCGGVMKREVSRFSLFRFANAKRQDRDTNDDRQ